MQEAGTHLETLRLKLSQIDYQKLCAITNPTVHQFIAEADELCNPKSIFICNDSTEDIAYAQRQALATGEDRSLATSRHTFHFDGPYDQGRDRDVTKYLVPKGDHLSKALNQIERNEGLVEVKGLLKDAMKGRIMIVRFV